MAKSKPNPTPNPALFAATRHRRVLILPRFLEEEAENQRHRDDGPALDNARTILAKWADMESKGRLKKKETALDANFLSDVFGTALRYQTVEHADTDGSFTLDRQFTVPGVGPADGALGFFPVKDASNPKPVAVIELKGSDTDLDSDKSNGRTAVQQLFDYLNPLPDTHWGILSNFSTIRLYRKDRGPQAYEEFSLQKLRSDPKHFHAFWCLFEKFGLLPTTFAPIPRADDLVSRTDTRQKEVGNVLYNYYAGQRVRLVEHLQSDHGKTFEQAVHIAQKLLNRIIFISFCEDRGLLPPNIVKRTAQLPPVFRVTNPLWRQFLDLFYLVDKGHEGSEIAHGYNGGLFAHDDEVDSLQLADSWVTIFTEIAAYDFQHEVNVDVLGHIFERSLNEVQRARIAGLFDQPNGPQASPKPPKSNGAASAEKTKKSKMLKSPERKRSGTYYTPPEFTSFIVQNTIAELIPERLEPVIQKHMAHTPTTSGMGSVTHPDLLDPPARIAFHQACIQALRDFKIIDPACGSGAFLIAAFDTMEFFYTEHINTLIHLGDPKARALLNEIPQWIVHENLHGVDLSEEAVEITRLALWIRSARPGQTLADLSHNIICGNSLVDDKSVHPRALVWPAAFPEVLKVVPTPSSASPADHRPPITDHSPGFDAVIGNPPWERLKLQEREFFDMYAPAIASAVSAADRRKLIEKLESENPVLHAKYLAAKNEAEAASAHVRASGHFPLTAKGDINTYMLFAELARTLVAPTGRVGLLVPSGIATDDTTKDFFGDLIDSEALVKLYDFENKLGVFPDVHRAFKFCTLILNGSAKRTPKADFVFFAHSMEDLEIKKRHIVLSKRDIANFNPNTKTCPIFRSRRDAEITKGVYDKVQILIDYNRKEGGNPWDIRFVTMFHQTNDAEYFKSAVELQKRGFKLEGANWSKGKNSFLPLYEAKMAQAFDHRAASVLVDEENWMRQGQTQETTLLHHQNHQFITMPRFWIDQAVVNKSLPLQPFLLGFKDITSPTNQRTMIAAAIPYCGVTNHFVLLRSTATPLLQLCLLGNLNSFAYDYIARQKIGGITLNFFIVEQLPTLPPDVYTEKTYKPRWTKKQTPEQWISERVLKLSCTANDMIPLAKACNFNPDAKPPHVWKWKDQERADLRAQLDAAYFHLYGISRDDAAYILSTFQTSGSTDQGKTIAPHSIAELILSYYDQYAAA